MKPPERFKQRVFPLWQPPAYGWQSISHHEAGHIVAAECYGVAARSAVVDLHSGCGYAQLGQLNDPPEDRTGEDEERTAIRMMGVVGLADTLQTFEEMALRAAVIYMAGATG
ncbi:MAG: hypothetical protein WDM70_02010 [Nitrosomonadales bacterium]